MEHQNEIAGFSLHPLLNTAVIKDFFGDDTQHLQSIFADFLQEAPLFSGDIQQAWQTNDMAGLRAVIHRFRPLYFYVGLSTFYEQLEVFENLVAGESCKKAAEDQYNLALKYIGQGQQLIAAELTRMKEYNAALNAN